MKQNLTNPLEISLYQDFVSDYQGKPLEVIPGTEETVKTLIKKEWLEVANTEVFCVTPVVEVKNSDEALCLLLASIRDYDFENVMKNIDYLKSAITETGIPELDGVYDDRKVDVCYGKFLNV